MRLSGSKRPLFEVRESPIHGRGVFARRPIPKGARIVEYVGERITHEEADERYDGDDAAGRHHTFLFIADERTVIDAAFGGSEARFINHSCDPNCEAVNEGGRVFIEAVRGIARGEELAYDYNLERAGRYRAEWKKLYTCRCGAESCRGTMLAPRPERRAKGKPQSKREGRRTG